MLWIQGCLFRLIKGDFGYRGVCGEGSFAGEVLLGYGVTGCCPRGGFVSLG